MAGGVNPVSSRRYTKQFKLQAVKLVMEHGISSTQAAKDLGVSQVMLSTWVRKYKAQGESALPDNRKQMPTIERVEQLEKALRRVTLERDILKKAIACFVDLPD